MEPEELSELELTTVEDWEPTVGREESRRPGTEESESVKAGRGAACQDVESHFG